CVAAAWLLTLALRKNRAAVRYWLWLAASVKFLIPFSLLASLGSQLGWRSGPAIAQPQFISMMTEVSRPFAIPVEGLGIPTGPQTASEIPAILIGVWLCGVGLGLVFWIRTAGQIRAIKRAA